MSAWRIALNNYRDVRTQLIFKMSIWSSSESFFLEANPDQSTATKKRLFFTEPRFLQTEVTILNFHNAIQRITSY